ncbi:heme-binding protein [Asaia prunellae]|uniref:heme-binding protein n=1 Tax=Asaia prunellae TaxID=610245 RepID=UPI000AD93271|nr:heme-binding protein [Asaia prunellae]
MTGNPPIRTAGSKSQSWRPKREHLHHANALSPDRQGNGHDQVYTDRFCCSILNEQGQEILFFRSHEILPCNEGLSRAKAVTAHAFQCDTQTFSDLPQITAAIRDIRYCFLAGGIVSPGRTGETLFIGLSSDKPEIDHLAAQAAAQALASTEISS